MVNFRSGNMFGLFKKIKFLEILLLFVLSLTPLLWLHNGHIIFGHDSGFRLNMPQFWTDLFYSWTPIKNFGTDWSEFKGFLIVQFPEVLFSFLTGSLMNGQKITFIFWFFTMGISMYTFTNSLYPQVKFWILRVSASVFYMYNFFILQAWLITERAKFSIFAALPLGLLILYKTINKEYSLTKGAILFSLVFFLLNGGGSAPLFGSALLVYTTAFTYLTISNVRKNGYKEILFSLKLAGCFMAGFLLINAFWVLPQINLMLTSYNSSLSAQGGINGVIAWINAISKSASILNILRLQGIAEWYDNPLHPYSSPYLNNPLLIFSSFFPISITIVGFVLQRIKILKKNSKLITLIFLCLIIGIIFTAGSHPPFGHFYLSLISSIPGFAIFRSPFYKFGPAVWFSIIFLFAYYVNLLLNRFVKKQIIKNIMGFLFIAFILVYHFPFFTTNFFIWDQPWTTKIKIPNYVYRMSEYINSQTPSYSRVLLLPLLDSDFGADGYRWGYWGLDPLPELTTDRSIIARAQDSEFGVPQHIYETLVDKNESDFSYLMGTYGINKILWRDDILYSNKVTSGKDFLTLKKSLLSFRSINLEKKLGEWSLYNIASSRILPLVYMSKSLNKFNLELVRLQKKDNLDPYLLSPKQNEQNTNFPVLFQKVNPTKYIVNVKNAKDNYVLVFNQAFDRNWQAYIQNDSLESNHVVVNGYVNGWIIDKKGNYEIALEYTPQKIFYIGAFISAITLLFGIFIYFTKIRHPKIL